MRKYLKMIPIIFYPYAYLVPLLILFLAPENDTIVDYIFDFTLFYAIALHVLVLFIALYNSIVTARGKYTLVASAKINLVTKSLQIPAYIFHFLLGILGVLMSIWGIGIVLFVLVVDFLTIAFTGISSIGCTYIMWRKKSLKTKNGILMGIGSFIYCIDVVIAFLYVFIAKEKDVEREPLIDEDFLKGIYRSKYPCLLVHGMGFRDGGLLNYWGRIPATLEANGYKVYYGNQDANGSIIGNATKLKNLIEDICLKDNVEKFNVIAHSKGGLDMRYAISKLGIGGKIASLTTISTPHNGSLTIDKIMKFPKFLVKFGSALTDIWFRICGDKKPETYRIITSFQTEEAKRFNEEIVDDPNVYYQSYAFVMKKHFSDIIMWFPHMVVKHIEGENDGFLSPDSVKWGDFRGIYRGTTKRGISHSDETDIRRHCFSKKKPKSEFEVSDITMFYVSVVNRLVNEKGF